jgi:hypothetical protein
LHAHPPLALDDLARVHRRVRTVGIPPLNSLT